MTGDIAVFCVSQPCCLMKNPFFCIRMFLLIQAWFVVIDVVYTSRIHLGISAQIRHNEQLSISKASRGTDRQMLRVQINRLPVERSTQNSLPLQPLAVLCRLHNADSFIEASSECCSFPWHCFYDERGVGEIFRHMFLSIKAWSSPSKLKRNYFFCDPAFYLLNSALQGNTVEGRLMFPRPS